jgi:hypothetical protein
MRYPNGARNDPSLGNCDNYSFIITQYDLMIVFRSKFIDSYLVVSGVYAFSLAPGNPPVPAYTFTVFHGPYY